MKSLLSQSSSRRHFLRTAAGAALATPLVSRAAVPFPETPGERPPARPDGVTIGNPFGGQVPVTFIIDDSTCLVNMGHYCMPQFAEAWGEKRYDSEWRDWPREIPDDFVRRFGEFCQGEGVKGKYSVVPFPAMVGWVDREMPGWSKSELTASRNLVRDFLMPDWDIHPEMISHTRVIDISSGRPLPKNPDGSYWMENGGWCAGKSVDEIASYIAYALEILRNAELPCEGFTTPGGFGNPAKEFLEVAGREAVRSIFPGTEIPHYFKYVLTDPNESVAPRVQLAKGIEGPDPECMVDIPSCTGDWFGAWHGGSPNPTNETADRHITEDGSAGRLVEVIEKGEPAAFLTHWPSLYANGSDTAYGAFRLIVQRVNAHYGKRIRWMKLTEIARYWAARELTTIGREESGFTLQAPFAAPGFTIRVPRVSDHPTLTFSGEDGEGVPLTRQETSEPQPLPEKSFRVLPDSLEICIPLAKGRSEITVS